MGLELTFLQTPIYYEPTFAKQRRWLGRSRVFRFHRQDSFERLTREHSLSSLGFSVFGIKSVCHCEERFLPVLSEAEASNLLTFWGLLRGVYTERSERARNDILRNCDL